MAAPDAAAPAPPVQDEGSPSEDRAEVQFFAGQDCGAMLKTFAELLKTKPIQELRTAAEQLKAAYYRQSGEAEEALRAKFAATGGAPEDFAPPADPLEAQLKDLLAQYRTLRGEYAKKTAAERADNLLKKQALIEELKQLLGRQDDFNAVFNDFKKLQQRWHETGMPPPEHQSDIWRTYNHNVEKFYDMVKINRELRELDFKKNYELKQLLCEKAENLLLEKDVTEAFKKLQKYHDQWREIGPVSPEHRKAIWERFCEVSAMINKRHNEHFEQQKQERQNNLQTKQNLCQQAEEILAYAPSSLKKWNEQTEQIIALQQKWKGTGAAPHKESEQVYSRFKTACNAFFEARKKFLKQLYGEYADNLQKKTALCEQAEGLSGSEDWDKTTSAFIVLQKQWRETGAVPRREAEAVWNRFKNACNAFFDRKKEHFANKEDTWEANLQAKEALIAEMQNCTAQPEPQENIKMLEQFQQRWTDIGAAPKKDAERIRLAYRETLAALYKTLNISETQRRLQEFKHQMQSDQDPQHLRLEHDKIVRQIKYLENEKRLLDNNINFFAKSKNAEQFIADIRAKIEKHTQEIALLKDKLALLKGR